jgi:hypothetical protein
MGIVVLIYYVFSARHVMRSSLVGVCAIVSFPARGSALATIPIKQRNSPLMLVFYHGGGRETMLLG